MDEIHNKIQQIIDSGELERLKEFEIPELWSTLSKENAQELAYLFIMRAECELQEGQEAAAHSFIIAGRIEPRLTAGFLRMQLAEKIAEDSYSAYALLACGVLGVLSTYHPDCYEVWFIWGTFLNELGIHYDDGSCFEEAEKKFMQAQPLRPTNDALDSYNLFWRWGCCYSNQALISGEAVDFMKALSKYAEAAKEGVNETTFWIDYGMATQSLGFLVSRKDLYEEAICWFNKATETSPNFFEAWYHLACTRKRLYETTHLIDDLFRAHDDFKRAAEINNDHTYLWLHWGKMLLLGGKEHHAIELIRQSAEKFEKFATLHPEEQLYLLSWTETLLLLGTHFERLDLLREAEEKSARCVRIMPEKAEAWCIYGACLSELGRYFRSISYYKRVLEQLYTGLACNNNVVSIWYGLASAHYAIGCMAEDIDHLKKAVECCDKIIEVSNIGKEEEDYPQILNDMGMALMKLAEFTGDPAYIEKALHQFEAAINFRNDAHDNGNLTQVDPDWVYNYGCALDLHGELTDDERSYEKAVQILTKLILLDPKYGFARYNLALATAHLADAVGDVESFQKAIELFHNIISQDHEDDDAWNEWGNTLLHFAELMYDPVHPQHAYKLYEQAEGKFQQAAALGNEHAYYNLASLYSLTGNYSLAMHFLEKAEMAGTLPPIEELKHDDWLEGLRAHPDFHQFIEHIQKKR